MRLHSCYFSKQYLETTVVDQSMLEMLYKGFSYLQFGRMIVLFQDYMQPFAIVSNTHV